VQPTFRWVLGRIYEKQTIEDRFVPRDDGCFMAQGCNEGRRREVVVIARRNDVAIFIILDCD